MSILIEWRIQHFLATSASGTIFVFLRCETLTFSGSIERNKQHHSHEIQQNEQFIDNYMRDMCVCVLGIQICNVALITQ